MPVCSFYLKGICNIDHCPYRHVNVNVNAEICKDFVRGFCEKGDQVSIWRVICSCVCEKLAMQTNQSYFHQIFIKHQTSLELMISFFSLHRNLVQAASSICSDQQMFQMQRQTGM